MTDDRCDLPRLSEFIDGELDGAARAALDTHLATCESCRGVVADLMRLRDAARGLGPVAPPAHVWTSVQASLPGSRRQARLQWIGLAAALVLVTLGAYAVTRVSSPDAPAAHTDMASGNASATPTVESVEDELAKAAAHYEAAIRQLEAVASRDALPADTAAKLQVSLAQVDRFIADSRAALVSEPQSLPARDSLFTALRRKVEILQQTVALVGAMQRGDHDAAARAAGNRDGKS
jgi:hypothetical protein